MRDRCERCPLQRWRAPRRAPSLGSVQGVVQDPLQAAQPFRLERPHPLIEALAELAHEVDAKEGRVEANDTVLLLGEPEHLAPMVCVLRIGTRAEECSARQGERERESPKQSQSTSTIPLRRPACTRTFWVVTSSRNGIGLTREKYGWNRVARVATRSTELVLTSPAASIRARLRAKEASIASLHDSRPVSVGSRRNRIPVPLAPPERLAEHDKPLQRCACAPPRSRSHRLAPGPPRASALGRSATHKARDLCSIAFRRLVLSHRRQLWWESVAALIVRRPREDVAFASPVCRRVPRGRAVPFSREHRA